MRIELFLFTAFFCAMPASAQRQESAPKPAGYKSLLSHVTTSITAGGGARRVVEIKELILTPEGATQKSNYKVESTNPAARFKLIQATVKTDGVSYKVQPRDVLTGLQAAGTAGLLELHEYTIPLPHVKVGSEITVIYEITHPPLVAGLFSDAAIISNIELAADEAQTYISDKPIHVIGDGFGEFYSLKESQSEGKYKVEIRPTEMARALVGHLEKHAVFYLSSADSWAQLNKGLGPKYEEAIRQPLPPAFAAIAASARQLKTPAEQIESVARALQSRITYSGTWLTVAGQYFPAGHKKVLERGHGDCKDYSTSMAAILRQLGFQANVALSFRRLPGTSQELIQKMPKLASTDYFNHAIVWAKDKDGKAWWVDPTNPLVVAGVLSSDLLGNFALVLDGGDGHFEQLPEKNAQPDAIHLRQTVVTEADNSVDVTATLTLNAAPFNQVAMVERQVGHEKAKLIMGAILNPQARSVVDYEARPQGENSSYFIHLSSLDWIREVPGSSKRIYINHPIVNYLRAVGAADEWDFGPPGVFDSTTVIKNEAAVDPVQFDCIGRSQWLDFDRSVTVKGAGTEIKDRVVVKARFVDKAGYKSDDFETLMSAARSCILGGSIVTSLNAAAKTVHEMELDKLRGPPLEKMTDADAKTLEDRFNLEVRDYVLQKLYRYYLLKIEKDPKDLEAYAKIATNLRMRGYLVADTHAPGFLRDGLEYVRRGNEMAGGQFNVALASAKVRLESDLGDKAAALKDYLLLNQKDPQGYDTAYLGFYLNKKEKRYQEAEKWARVALTRAPANKKRIVQDDLARLHSSQGRHAEALMDMQDTLNSPDVTPWDWHNAAIEYAEMKDYDRCIELEKKALAKADFGAARKEIAYALLSKGILNLPPKGRAPLHAFDSSETLMLEALKWKPKDVYTLVNMERINLRKYFITRNPEYYDKAKEYLDRANLAEPNSPQVAQNLKYFSKVPTDLDTRPRRPASQ